MKCSNCKKSEAFDNGLCLDCMADFTKVKELKPSIICPNCKKETRIVFEYSTENFEHRKVFSSYDKFLYQDFDIITKYYTCLECNKQFSITVESERE